MQGSLPSKVWLSLGSNVGDRMQNLRLALTSLNELPDTRLEVVSPIYETAPWGEIDQPKFYNLAVEIGTVFEPLELLNSAKLIETRLGRRPGPTWGPRVIDIDLILWEGRAVTTADLTIPHPHFTERAFVLIPLNDIASTLVDSGTGLTIAELLEKVEGRDGVTLVDDADILSEITKQDA